MATEIHLPEIAGVIQLAVAPVFMLTAVGTLINALSIRLARAADRRRTLEDMLATLQGTPPPTALAELDTIGRRVRLVYMAILFAVISGLFVCMLIATAFVGAFIDLDISMTIGLMFIVAIFSLLCCLLLFLREIFLAVWAPRYIPG